MLNYIKEQLLAREKATAVTFDDDDVDDKIVVECAHLFQELDDISVEGTDSIADRPIAIDIPLEDDVEIDSVEFNIGDGRITDVPMDATVQESVNEVMKTFDDFYQEAFDSTVRFPRDSDDAFRHRVMNVAIKNHNDYIADVEKKGLFGFDKISIESDEVPSGITIAIDIIGNTRKSVLAPVYWQSRFGNKVSKNQLDALTRFVSTDQALKLSTFIKDYLTERYPDEISKVDNIWSVIGIPSIYVPKQKGNATVIIDYGKTPFTEDGELAWKVIIPSSVDSTASVEHINNSTNNLVMYKSFKTKKEIIKEYAEMPKRTFSRFGEDQTFYQEAIDFGIADDKSGDDAPPVDEPTNADETTVSVDGGDDKKEDSLPVDTNDISDDIAKKVSNETMDDDKTTDDIDTGDVNNELDGIGDEPVDTSLNNTDDNTAIDSKLDDLNSMSDTGEDDITDDGVTDDIDFDDMTMDDLLEKGTEKLKGMTMAQLKEFMNGNPDAKIDDTLTQESFFMTTKNINKKMSDQLRVVSGILNNTEMKFDDLVIEFKKQGKSLNKILSKVGKKAKKIYTKEDREAINKLNSILVDLINQFKSNPSQNEAIMIKRIIKEFVSRAAVVNEIIERVAGGKPVQESFQ